MPHRPRKLKYLRQVHGIGDWLRDGAALADIGGGLTTLHRFTVQRVSHREASVRLDHGQAHIGQCAPVDSGNEFLGFVVVLRADHSDLQCGDGIFKARQNGTHRQEGALHLACDCRDHRLWQRSDLVLHAQKTFERKVSPRTRAIKITLDFGHIDHSSRLRRFL